MNASSRGTRHHYAAQPETRPSLLSRLGRSDNDDSWRQFFELYVPVIFGIARRKGLQDADAWEVTQEVLMQLTRSMPRFRYDPDRGRFRGWLSRVIHSRLARHWKRQAQCHRTFESQSDLGDLAKVSFEPSFDEALAQQMVQLAMDQIVNHFEPDTWQAFLMTWRDQTPADQVAQKLDRPTGWVYVAKSRVLKRLGNELRKMLDSHPT